jgi:hypothetical protein
MGAPRAQFDRRPGQGRGARADPLEQRQTKVGGTRRQWRGGRQRPVDDPERGARAHQSGGDGHQRQVGQRADQRAAAEDLREQGPQRGGDRQVDPGERPRGARRPRPRARGQGVQPTRDAQDSGGAAHAHQRARREGGRRVRREQGRGREGESRRGARRAVEGARPRGRREHEPGAYAGRIRAGHQSVEPCRPDGQQRARPRAEPEREPRERGRGGGEADLEARDDEQMRSARIPDGSSQRQGHAPGISQDDGRQERRAARLEPPTEAVFRRKPRPLRPVGDRPDGARRGAGELDAVGAQDPGGPGRRDAGLLVVVPRVARTPRRPQSPDDAEVPAGHEDRGVGAFRQPELGALRTRRGWELHQGPPAGAGPPDGGDEPPLHARVLARGVPSRVARRGQRPAAPGGEDRESRDDGRPKQDAAEDHPSLRPAPRKSSRARTAIFDKN